MTRAFRGRPMTALSLSYAALAFALVATHLIDPSGANVVRLTIAGFLLIFAAVLIVICGLYLPSAIRTDWRGLLPRHVVKVTAASSLTILWVCIELWARTAGRHYGPPAAPAHAAVAGALWLWSLSDVMRFERRRVDTRTRSVELRHDTSPDRGRREEDHG